MTKAIRQDPDYPMIMMNAADKQFKVGNWLTARNLYELAMKHVACTAPRKAECEDMIQEIDRITTGGSRQIRLELIDVDKLSDIDRLKMFFDNTSEDVKAERYKVLKKSIEERGILVPIDVAYVVEAKTRDEKDEIGDNLKETAWKILDGYTRVQIAKELGITQVRAFIHSAQFIKNDAKAGNEKGDPLVNYGLVINIKRRHMTDEEKHKVLIALAEGIVKGVGGRPKRGEEKKPSIVQKAGELGVSESTLRKHLVKEEKSRHGDEVSVRDALNKEKPKPFDRIDTEATLLQGKEYIGSGWSGAVKRVLGGTVRALEESEHVKDSKIKQIKVTVKLEFFK